MDRPRSMVALWETLSFLRRDTIAELEAAGFQIFDPVDWGHFVTSGQSWAEYQAEAELQAHQSECELRAGTQ